MIGVQVEGIQICMKEFQSEGSYMKDFKTEGIQYEVSKTFERIQIQRDSNPKGFK